MQRFRRSAVFNLVRDQIVRLAFIFGQFPGAS
jgi:hypothetical protein